MGKLKILALAFRAVVDPWVLIPQIGGLIMKRRNMEQKLDKMCLDKPPCGLGLYRCQSGKNCIPTEYICDGVQELVGEKCDRISDTLIFTWNFQVGREFSRTKNRIAFMEMTNYHVKKLEILATLLSPSQLGPQLPPQALHKTPPLKVTFFVSDRDLLTLIAI